MPENPDLELLLRAWEALSVGDLSVVEEALDANATWRAVRDGPWNCEGRQQILDVLSQNVASGLRGEIEEMIPDGGRILVAFRPELPRSDERPLDDGVAFVVVTMHDHRIVELKGCANRAAALSYMRDGDQPGADPVEQGPWPAAQEVDPSAPHVNQLVPFVHVEDVARSVDFYRHLGFTVKSAHEYKGRPVWVAVSSHGAELMLTLDGDPIEPAGQGVLFYLYSPDLAGLRSRLLAAGIEAGEIVDGSPGPDEEMKIVDPDGYVLMVAQIEP